MKPVTLRRAMSVLEKRYADSPLSLRLAIEDDRIVFTKPLYTTINVVSAQQIFVLSEFDTGFDATIENRRMVFSFANDYLQEHGEPSIHLAPEDETVVIRGCVTTFAHPGLSDTELLDVLISSMAMIQEALHAVTKGIPDCLECPAWDAPWNPDSPLYTGEDPD